jgi:hypothetical protein
LIKLPAIVITGGLVAAACGGSPATPPPVVNTPPVIESLTIAPRAEADRPLQITATVKDTETPISQLTYTWSASPQSGTFSGTGAAVMWKPPKGQKTPDLYTISLTVTEAYTSAGQAKQNSVSGSATVRYNDSPAEVAFVGRDFLVTKFGDVNVGAAEAVSNFSDSCPGKAAEFEDVKNNRINFEILTASFTAEAIAFDSTLTTGTVDGPCRFEDKPRNGPNAGRIESVSGSCHLTTVYENFRWLLCESTFSGETTLESLRGRVPGRVVRAATAR